MQLFKKRRVVIVLIFLLMFTIFTLVDLGITYSSVKDIGEKYLDVFFTNVKYKYITMLANFIIVFMLIYITTRMIKRGLKKFFIDEKKEMPKLPNKSISFIGAIVISITTSSYISSKLIIAVNSWWFGINDNVFNRDIGFYMFQRPFMWLAVIYFILLIIGLTIYIATYYIISFNTYFDGVDREILKKNTFIKHLLFNIFIVSLGLSLAAILKSHDVLFEKFIHLKDELDTYLYGAGFTAINIKVWGYRILSGIIPISVLLAMRAFKKQKFKRIILSVLIVPAYFVIMVVFMGGTQFLFVKPNELNRERNYISTNIENTKNAYGINIEEIQISDTKEIREEDIGNNKILLNNISIISKEATLKTLMEYQTNVGNYTFPNTSIANINNELVYISPRESLYSYEETNGFAAIITKASSSDQMGGIEYVSKEFIGTNLKNSNTYYGTLTNEEHKNKNIIERAKKIAPFLTYDPNPYLVLREDNSLIWVLDAYTVSNEYPYSQSSLVEINSWKERINYIRNSVKVLIDPYNGEIKFYITDATDPIARAYQNIYNNLFENIDEKIPEDISKHFIYPEYLYNIQAEMIERYHNISVEALFRSDDVWTQATYNNGKSKVTPVYTTIDNQGNVGLVMPYTPYKKSNITAYLVGTKDKLSIYKFSKDSNILGPTQLEKEIAQDEVIAEEIKNLEVTGTKLIKNIIVVPIENTILYIEPIYQVSLNESPVPVLKKIVAASSNKIAIGNTLEEALERLVSKYAVDIEVENTDDEEGLTEAIVRANNNLKNSIKNNDWELIGKDMKKLQELIDKLETLRKKEEQKTNITVDSVNEMVNEI